jgi:hypothetical protein
LRIILDFVFFVEIRFKIPSIAHYTKLSRYRYHSLSPFCSDAIFCKVQRGTRLAKRYREIAYHGVRVRGVRVGGVSGFGVVRMALVVAAPGGAGGMYVSDVVVAGGASGVRGACGAVVLLVCVMLVFGVRV